MPVATAAADPDDETAGNVLRAPGVVNWPEVAIQPRRTLAQSVHIRFSDYDCASFFKLCDTNGIFVWHAVFESFKGRGRFDPGGIVKVFDRVRNAMQRTTPLSCLDLCFSGCGQRKRLISQDGNECVELWVNLFNSLETTCEHLYGRQFLRPNAVMNGCDIFDV